MELNKIYNMDCLEGMKLLPDGTDEGGIDLIIADPPYHKIIKEKWDNQFQTLEQYFDWLKECMCEFKRISKPNASIYIWNTWQNIFEIRNIAIDMGLHVKNCITWNRGGGKERNNWSNQKECLLYLSMLDKPIFNLNDVLIDQDDETRKMSKSSWERCKYQFKERKTKVNPSNVWTDPFIRSNSREYVGHPTQKPLTICDRIVKASSEINNTVFIPFVGSGSEIISCVLNKRNYIGMEKEVSYIAIANKRLQGISKT